MNFDEYQRATRTTAIYANSEEMPTRRERLKVLGADSILDVLSTARKAGQYSDQFKKYIRDGKEPIRSYGSGGLIEQHNRMLDVGFETLYTIFGLLSEAGEIAEVVIDFIEGRIDDKTFAKRIEKEGGDELWYLSELATNQGQLLGGWAEGNVEKLASRKDRGKLQGSGDDR